jgi:hypothetical protein
MHARRFRCTRFLPLEVPGPILCAGFSHVNQIVTARPHTVVEGRDSGIAGTECAI